MPAQKLRGGDVRLRNGLRAKELRRACCGDRPSGFPLSSRFQVVSGFCNCLRGKQLVAAEFLSVLAGEISEIQGRFWADLGGNSGSADRACRYAVERVPVHHRGFLRPRAVRAVRGRPAPARSESPAAAWHGYRARLPLRPDYSPAASATEPHNYTQTSRRSSNRELATPIWRDGRTPLRLDRLHLMTGLPIGANECRLEGVAEGPCTFGPGDEVRPYVGHVGRLVFRPLGVQSELRLGYGVWPPDGVTAVTPCTGLPGCPHPRPEIGGPDRSCKRR